MQRERDKESLLLARENRKRERALRRQQEHELQRAMAQTAKQRREERRLKAAFAPLPDVLSEADVVLVVLDARDPAACRCAALERALIDCDKLPVLVLTKVDLVPKAAAEGWLKALRASLPAVPFSCGDAPAKPAATGGAAAAAAAAPPAVGAEALAALVQSRAALAPPAEGAKLSVGVVGFDRVGKRSLLRALGR